IDRDGDAERRAIEDDIVEAHDDIRCVTVDGEADAREPAFDGREMLFGKRDAELVTIAAREREAFGVFGPRGREPPLLLVAEREIEQGAARRIEPMAARELLTGLVDATFVERGAPLVEERLRDGELRR